jgi:hypothetical protein
MALLDDLKRAVADGAGRQENHRDQRNEGPALDLSRRIAGGLVRAGAAERAKLERLEALGVRIDDAG